MAKKLVLDENGKYKIQYSYAGKNTSFYEGAKGGNILSHIFGKDKYSHRYTEFGGLSIIDLKKHIQASVNELKKVPEFQTQMGELEAYGFLKAENLEKFSNKELKRIFKVMSKMNVFARDYNRKKDMLNTPFGASLKKRYLEAFQVYTDSLNGINKGMTNLEKLNNFDIDAFARDIDKSFNELNNNNVVQSNLSSSHLRDLEVVRALEFVGINLKRTRNENTNTLMWELDEEKTALNQNGLEYTDENNQTKYFKLDNAQIQSFLSQYLNRTPAERNNALITPEGIFKLYLEEASTGLTKIFGKVVGFGRDGNKTINDAIKEAENKYNINNSEWKNFAHASDRMAIMDGAKLALVDLYATDGLKTDKELISQGLQDQIESNPHVNSKWLNKLIRTAENFRDHALGQTKAFEDANSLLSQYQKEKEILENKAKVTQLSTNEQEALESLTQTIETIGVVRSFVTNVAREVPDGDKDKWLQVVNTLSESDLIEVTHGDNGYEITVKDENELLSDDLRTLCETIANDMNSGRNSKDQDEQSQDGMDEEDIFAKLFEKATERETNNLGNGIKQWAVYDFTDNYFSNCSADNEFKVIIDKYRKIRQSDPTNPNYKDFKTFVENTFDEEQKKDFGSPFFTLDALSNYEARTRDNTPEYQNTNDYKSAMTLFTDMGKNANKFLAMLARTRTHLGELSPDDSQLNITPENLQNAYTRTLNEMRNPDFALTDEEKDIAKLYKDYTQRAYAKNALEGYMQGNNINDGSTLSKDMRNLCSKMFTDKELEDQIEDIANKEGKESDEEQTKKVIEKIKFSDKYPKDKTANLLKKFKPYCDKSTSKIIEKMMEMIEKCDLIIDKSKAKDSEQSEDPKAPVDPKVEDPKGKDDDSASNDDQGKKQGDGQNRTADDIPPTPEDNQNKDQAESEPVQPEPQQPEPAQPEPIQPDPAQSDEHFQPLPTPEPTPQPEPEITKFELNPEPNPEPEPQPEPPKTEPEMDVNGINGETMGISEGEFATYRILSVGLRAVLQAKSFEKNREWLNENETKKIESLSNVLGYITTPSTFAKGSNEYEKDLKLKAFLAGELDMKAKLISSSKVYNTGLASDVEEFYTGEFAGVIQPDLLQSIDYVMHNCRNIEDIGQLMCITTDLPTNEEIKMLPGGGAQVQMKSGEKFQIGNKLSQEDIKAISACKSDKELWGYIRKNNELYQGVWNVPGSMSEKLADYLKQMDQGKSQDDEPEMV